MNDTASTQRDVIAKYLSSEITDDILYAQLADDAGLGADIISKSAEGKALFARIWKRQRQAICSNSIVQAYIKNPNVSDTTTICSQVLNLLIVVPGINMALVACLAVRIGLRLLCSEAKT